MSSPISSKPNEQLSLANSEYAPEWLRIIAAKTKKKQKLKGFKSVRGYEV